MQRRYVTIWFRFFKPDWFTRRHPQLSGQPFVVYAPEHGRMMVTAANLLAEAKGIFSGTVLADARAIVPGLQAMEDKPEVFVKVLKHFAEWFIRYSPIVAIDPPDGLIIDTTGCPHLWGGEEKYLLHIQDRLNSLGYTARMAMAGTIGGAWAITHYGRHLTIVQNGYEADALLQLPPQSLRIEEETAERLHKLGLKQINNFIGMPRHVLFRRFGNDFITRLEQALGKINEIIQPVEIIPPYTVRLNCLEPIVTLAGIEIALQQLLENLCKRLHQEQKGIRTLVFKTFRTDGKQQQLIIGTNSPSSNTQHLFKLFALKFETIEPGLGIELFVLEATKTEDHLPAQEKIWNAAGELTDTNIAMLLDRLANKIGGHNIHRYLPDEHYWPERSVKESHSLDEKIATEWNAVKPRPLRILLHPEPITVTAPIPDYPPMLFRHKGKVHKIVKADGPERIEQEWWIQEGLHRDYYYVEDEEGRRYWLFRSGHYAKEDKVQWFLHGFCA